MLCRTLWKSYLLSWRTKLAKLLCLKCFGRMCFVNFSFCEQVLADALSTVQSCCALHCLVSLPPALRSCLLRCPSVLRSRLVGSPASCGVIVSRRAGANAVASNLLTCIVCEPGSVSRWNKAAQCRRVYSQSRWSYSLLEQRFRPCLRLLRDRVVVSRRAKSSRACESRSWWLHTRSGRPGSDDRQKRATAVMSCASVPQIGAPSDWSREGV